LFQEIDEKMIVFSQKMKKKQPARVPYWNEKLMELTGNKETSNSQKQKERLQRAVVI